MLKKLLLVLGWLCFFPMQALAHNTQLATFHIIQQHQQWIMKISTAQVAVEQAIQQKHPAVDLQKISATEYQELVKEYCHQTINLTANHRHKISLAAGIIQMDGHQQDSYFRLENMPDTLSSLDMHISSFSEQEYHTNIVRVYYIAKKNSTTLAQKKIALSAKNDHHAQLVFEMQ